MRPVTNEECEALVQAARDGHLAEATLAQLRRWFVVICHPMFPAASDVRQAAEIAENVRMVLTMRLADAAERRTARLTGVAIAVGSVTLIAVAIQILLGVPPAIEALEHRNVETEGYRHAYETIMEILAGAFLAFAGAFLFWLWKLTRRPE